MSIVASRKSAALRVGVVTARVMSNVRLASAHASLQEHVVQGVRQRREVEDVLGHHVVRGDDRDAALARLARQAAADDDVRLDVHDVGLDGVEHTARVVLRHPRKHERQPVVREPAPGRKPVHRHRLVFDDLGRRSRRPVRGARRHDVHVVAARDETGGQALGEARGAVDVRREGVGADDDGQGSMSVRRRRRGIVGRLGRGHGMLVAYLCAGAGGARGCMRVPTVPEGPRPAPRPLAGGVGDLVRWMHAPTPGRRRPEALGAGHRLTRVRWPPAPQGRDPDAADSGEPRARGRRAPGRRLRGLGDEPGDAAS